MSAENEHEPFVPNEKQQKIIADLAQLQTALGAKDKPFTDQAFSKRLDLGGASRWNLIRNGKYWGMVKSPGTLFDDLQRAYLRFGAAHQFSLRFEGKRFVSNDTFDALFAGVEECQAKPMSDRKRVCVYLGETGKGKSMLSFELWKRFGAHALNARKDWTRKGRVALEDICRRFDLPVKQNDSLSDLENKLIAEFRSQQHVLVIDEGEYFGKEVLDCIKFFINESRLVVAILAYPEKFDRWNRIFKVEADQIRTRTHLLIRMRSITPAMADPFLDRVTWAGEGVRRTASERLLEAANSFGAFDLIDCVTTRLEGLKDKVDVKDFATILANESARMGVEK